MDALKTTAVWLLSRLVMAILILLSFDVLVGTTIPASPSSWAATLILLAILELELYAATQFAEVESNPRDEAIARNEGRLYELKRQLLELRSEDHSVIYDNDELDKWSVDLDTGGEGHDHA